MKYFCLDKNYASGTLNLRFIGFQNPCQVQNLKRFVDNSGVQKTTWAKFFRFHFFYLKRQGYIDIIRATIDLWSHIIFIHKSYNEIVDKIIFINPKTG